VVQDHGAGAPVAVGPASPGGGYGLTGMRERAELLGGRLGAEPTADGVRVELWLPG
jgi:signal transduction histidine kinase